MERDTYLARVRGCVLGGAIGDALGASLEFNTGRSIAERFGAAGIRDFVEGIGLVTDDTQMTLFTMDGLIRARVAYATKGICNPIDIIHRAYLRWLFTQELLQPPAVDDAELDRWPMRPGQLDGWLTQQDWLYARRAPGMTCVRALAQGRDGAWTWPADNNSKGCGTVMRSAPFGLAKLNDSAALAVSCSEITHGHPTAGHASGALALIIEAIVWRDQSLKQAVDAARAWLLKQPDAAEMLNALDQAIKLAASDVPPSQEAVESLGGGWIAEEALAIGVYAALAYPSKEQVLDALALAASHGGDCDSTGSICGNIVGALHGVDALPAHLLNRLEGLETLEQISRNFVAVIFDLDSAWHTAEPGTFGVEGPPPTDAMLERYPPW